MHSLTKDMSVFFTLVMCQIMGKSLFFANYFIQQMVWIVYGQSHESFVIHRLAITRHNPFVCICVNKEADQLCSKCFCFDWSHSTITLLAFLCNCIYAGLCQNRSGNLVLNASFLTLVAHLWLSKQLLVLEGRGEGKGVMMDGIFG